MDADVQLDLWEGRVQGESISYGQVTQDGYVMDLYTERAVEFINRPRDRSSDGSIALTCFMMISP